MKIQELFEEKTLPSKFQFGNLAMAGNAKAIEVMSMSYEILGLLDLGYKAKKPTITGAVFVANLSKFVKLSDSVAQKIMDLVDTEGADKLVNKKF